MIVEGLTNPSHVIRSFLINEYAFSIAYITHEVRIAHHKGTWYCVKIKNDAVEDSILIQDDFSGVVTDSEMAEALYEQIQVDSAKKIHFPSDRRDEAYVIEKFLRIWGGRTGTVVKISAVQPGRNASINQDTGDFVLSPAELEFKD